jgi:hypothetical protein
MGRDRRKLLGQRQRFRLLSRLKHGLPSPVLRVLLLHGSHLLIRKLLIWQLLISAHLTVWLQHRELVRCMGSSIQHQHAHVSGVPGRRRRWLDWLRRTERLLSCALDGLFCFDLLSIEQLRARMWARL